MSDPTPSHSDVVVTTPIRLRTTDDVVLAGCWFMLDRPSVKPSAVIVVLCGAGIPAKRYRRMANFLAGRGAAVLTFDYRGIGESDGKRVRKIESGMERWAEFDAEAALSEARERFPNLPLGAITHSVSALLIGAAPSAPRISRLVFFGPHTGYWRDYGRRWRPLLYLTWHTFMPAVTLIFGYFPGRILGLGSNLPRRVAFDWAGRRQPGLSKSPDDRRGFARLISRLQNVRAETLALSVTDDAFAPPQAAHRVLEMYPQLAVTHRITSPAAIGHDRVGHFGFLRRPTCDVFWCQAAEWLIPTFLSETTIHFQRCTLCGENKEAKSLPAGPQSSTL